MTDLQPSRASDIGVPEMEVLPSRFYLGSASGSMTSTDSSSQQYTRDMSSKSPISDMDLTEDGAESSSPSFIRYEYLSQIRMRRGRTATLPNMETATIEDGTISETDEANIGSPISSDTNKFNSSTGKHVKFFESQTQPVPAYAKPKILIKLMRVSIITDQIIDKETEQQSKESANSSPRDIDKEITITFASELARKRVGYLQRVRELFKPRSSISLNSLTNEEDHIPSKDTKTRKTNLRKSKSQTIVSDSNCENVSEESSKTQIKEKLQKLNGQLKEPEMQDQSPGTSPNVTIQVDQENNGSECECPSENPDQTSTSLQVHLPERSYSLLRKISEQNDSSHVNFTRIPSLRRKKVHVCLLHHFTTVFPPNDNDDRYVIKEATNIQPLENGESVVTDILSNNIVLFDAQGYPKITFAVESGCEPWATCLTPDGGLAVTLKRQGCVSLWSTSGEPISEFGQNVLSGPAGIQCDQLGRFVVADEQSNTVCVFNAQGVFLAKLSPEGKNVAKCEASLSQKKSRPPSNFQTSFFNHPRYICVTVNGNIVIADSANHCIKIFDPDMNFQSQFGCYGRGDSHFRFPYGVACDEENFLYVADHFNNRVCLFNPNGEFIEDILTSQDGIARPKSIAVKFPLLYVTYGNLRSNKISVFKLIKRP